MSLFAKWLDAKGALLSFPDDADAERMAWMELLSRRSPRYAALFDGWRPTTRRHLDEFLAPMQNLPAVYADAVDFTAFALDQFRERTDRDGAALAILATHYFRTRGHPRFERLAALAEPRGIPIIDQYGHMLQLGAERRDARWPHDSHWNAAGHQWAAEALLEWLQRNWGVCARVTTGQFTPGDGHIRMAELPVGAVDEEQNR